MTNKLSQMVSSLALLFLSAASLAAADRQTLQTAVPDSAKSQSLGPLPAANRLQLSIGLPLRNKNAAINLFHQMYDRGSAHYHRYLTPEQFARQFGPAEQDYQKVINYAKAHGLEVVHTFANRALVDVAGSVADVEGMFHVNMGTYKHPAEDREFYAPDVAPSVEADMPILYISGMDNFVIAHHRGHKVQIDKSHGPRPNGGSAPGSGLYMGSDFRHAYLPGTTLTGSGQVVGLFEPQGYNIGDIVDYENYAGLPNVLVTNVLDNYSINTTTNSGNDEVASDIELAIAMAPGLTQVSVYEGPSNESIINAMAEPSSAGKPRPNQLSASWGFETDTNVEQALIQIGLQGQSFMYAIGDGGAYQNGVNNNTEQDLLYMTAVGGTQLFMNGAGVSWSNEIVWNDGGPPTNQNYFAGTGGVLTQVPIPYYQQGVSMARNHGSTQYRNVPDVALVARDILIVCTATPANGPVPGSFFSWVGTSASAPLWAGLIALVNQQAASESQPPVGFINPALYQIGEGSSYLNCFHNITIGNNAWTNAANHTGSANLYYATNGYNLCDGWGTSAGETLVNALVSYSGPIFVNFNYNGTQTGSYAQPFKTLAGGINAVTPGGTIIIETAGSSSETPTISKSLTIIANDGPDTVGN